MVREEELDEEAWEIRETFAYFGRTFYAASVLEVGLAHALMYGDFMLQERKRIAASGRKTFDRAQHERDFDKYMDEQFSKTMGGIAKRVKELPYFDDNLKDRIFEANQRRNFLTHHYWRERSYEFANSAGRIQMQDELNKDAETFIQLDRDIDAALKPARAALGINDDDLEQHVRDKIQRATEGFPWDE